MSDKRRTRSVRPGLEGLESRTALSTVGGGPDPGYHEPGNHSPAQDHGNWEPKPIGNSSTRPTIPTGPTGPVR